MEPEVHDSWRDLQPQLFRADLGWMKQSEGLLVIVCLKGGDGSAPHWWPDGSLVFGLLYSICFQCWHITKKSGFLVHPSYEIHLVWRDVSCIFQLFQQNWIIVNFCVMIEYWLGLQSPGSTWAIPLAGTCFSKVHCCLSFPYLVWHWVHSRAGPSFEGCCFHGLSTQSGDQHFISNGLSSPSFSLTVLRVRGVLAIYFRVCRPSSWQPELETQLLQGCLCIGLTPFTSQM